MQRLLKTIQRENEDQKRLLQQPLMPEVEPDEDSPFFDSLNEAKTISTMTNFNRAEIIDMYQRLQPHVAALRRRGPKPKISWLDSLVLLLVKYKSNCDYGVLAAAAKRKEPTMHDAIARIRPMLNKILRMRWWENTRRPRPLGDPQYIDIALLIDSTSIQVFRPHAPFAEGKIYFDGKNKIYA